MRGVWIGTSTKFLGSSIISSNESILVFDLFAVHKDDFLKHKDSIEKRFFIKVSDYLFSKPIDGELAEIKRKIKLSNDSLTLENGYSDFIWNYYKIPDSLKFKSNDKIELKNKFFEIKNENSTDSIFFSENIMIRKKFNDYLNKITWNYDGYWKIVDANGFKVFLGNFSPMIVKSEKGKIKFYQFNLHSFKEIELKEFKGDRNDINKIIDNFNRKD